MLDISGIAVVAGALGSALLLWWFTLFVRPRLATQRLEIEAQRLRDELVDARRRGEVVCDDDHVAPLLGYLKAVTVAGGNLTLVGSIVLWRALHRAGLDVSSDDRQHVDQCRIAEFEERLDGLVWDHLISSSRLWFILEPARFLRGILLRDKKTRKPEELVTPAQRPSLLASGWRTAAEGEQGSFAREIALQLLEDPEPKSTPSHRTLVGVP